MLIAMNGPSLDLFEDTVAPGGWIFVNSSIISREVRRKDVHVFKILPLILPRSTGSLQRRTW